MIDLSKGRPWCTSAPEAPQGDVTVSKGIDTPKGEDAKTNLTYEPYQTSSD